MEYDLSPLLVGLEGAPEEHWMIVQEPAGEPAELPLPADVWTCITRLLLIVQTTVRLYPGEVWPACPPPLSSPETCAACSAQLYPCTVTRPGNVEEGGELTASIPEVKLVPARLVKVPGNINIDCVEPGGLQCGDSVQPGRVAPPLPCTAAVWCASSGGGHGSSGNCRRESSPPAVGR